MGHNIRSSSFEFMNIIHCQCTSFISLLSPWYIRGLIWLFMELEFELLKISAKSGQFHPSSERLSMGKPDVNI